VPDLVIQGQDRFKHGHFPVPLLPQVIAPAKKMFADIPQ